MKRFVIVLILGLLCPHRGEAAHISESLHQGLCLCTNEPNVVVIKNPGLKDSVIGTLDSGKCYMTNGGVLHVDGNTWYELRAVGGAQLAWVDGFYMTLSDIKTCNPNLNFTSPITTGSRNRCIIYGNTFIHGQKFQVHGLFCTCDNGLPACSFTGHHCESGGGFYPDRSTFVSNGQICTCANGTANCKSLDPSSGTHPGDLVG
ncbi:hypothetical protein CHS0354_029883 [Potamilus streckersoni]|uniref:Uncharacterized protein n=1 Tax=Potamilus streckersoni TaxID=2493646 RepID=A0AAE0VIE0_9BIVA|nr:hypothetical protein CHS0354_029883 [Potamilus streckersoni]